MLLVHTCQEPYYNVWPFPWLRDIFPSAVPVPRTWMHCVGHIPRPCRHYLITVYSFSDEAHNSQDPINQFEKLGCKILLFFFLGIVGTGLDFKLRQQWWTWWGLHYSKLERLWKTKHQLTSTALSKTAVMPNIMSQQSVRKAHHFTILSWQYDPTLW